MEWIWVNCPVCSHKLFKYEADHYKRSLIDMSIKCHSCKTILDVHIKGKYIQTDREAENDED